MDLDVRDHGKLGPTNQDRKTIEEFTRHWQKHKRLRVVIMLDLHASLNTGRPAIPKDGKPFPFGQNREEPLLDVSVSHVQMSPSLIGISQLLKRLLGATVYDLILPAEPNRETRQQSVGLISNMCGIMWRYQDARDEFFAAAAR